MIIEIFLNILHFPLCMGLGPQSPMPTLTLALSFHNENQYKLGYVQEVNNGKLVFVHILLFVSFH